MEPNRPPPQYDPKRAMLTRLRMANGIWGLPRRGNQGSTSGGPQANQPVPTFQPLQSVSGGMGRGMQITGGVQPYAQIGTQPIGGAANVPHQDSPPRNPSFPPRHSLSPPSVGSSPRTPPFRPPQDVRSPSQGSSSRNHPVPPGRIISPPSLGSSSRDPPFRPPQDIRSPSLGSSPRNPPFRPPQDVRSPYLGSPPRDLSLPPPQDVTSPHQGSPQRNPPVTPAPHANPSAAADDEEELEQEPEMTKEEWDRLIVEEYPLPPWQVWALGSDIQQRYIQNTLEAPLDEEDIEMRLYRYMVKLSMLVGSPATPESPRNHIEFWLDGAQSAVNSMGQWDRRDDSHIIRYIVHLEEAMFKIADAVPKQPGDPVIRPPHYRVWYKSNKYEDFIKAEVAATVRHAHAEAKATLRACTSPQQLIDEIARNRIWPLPWFSETEDQHGMTMAHFERAMLRRAEWVREYWKLTSRGKKLFFEEARGIVEDEAVYLLSWCTYHERVNVFPTLRDGHFPHVDTAAIDRHLDWDPPLLVANQDYYSSLFLHSVLDLCNDGKPRARGAAKQRVREHYDLVSRATAGTIMNHHRTNSVYTTEMATVLTSIMQNVLDWLMHDNDFDWFFADGQVPRAIYEQLQVVVHGISLYRPMQMLSRELLLSAQQPMPAGELRERILKHLKKNRREPADDEYEVDPAASDSASSRSSSRSARTKHVPRAGVAPHELKGRYWQMTVYNLETFPSLETVREKGEVRIRDMRYLPADIILAWGKYACFACLTKSPKTGVYRVFSIKDYDVTGKRNMKIVPDWIHNILMEKWYGGAGDLPLRPGQTAQVPEVWPDVNTVYATLEDAKGVGTVSAAMDKIKHPERQPKKLRRH
ncbi:hypothetical protein CALVIDRAFT_560680 [Calocera viscosa TUFC12733]|uniref:Putative Zn2Cys6 domain-containing protein n=1 Tax=Calocera viscosa (strain TUFC12733) TaxID=1330018 RepID=A0A167QML3_CALVF|nr:hypothetical protein CALVIDRAFT_560680 [Calocera viscosa TUFC12733]